VRKPIRDHSLPQAPAVMADILDYLARAVDVGHQVYVHCRAGIGRTNTVVGCWLRRGGLSGPEALARLNELWRANARSESWPVIPETDDQARYISTWTDPAAAAEAEPLVDLPAARALRDKYLGCLLGLACGDAIGSTLQFRKPGQFTPVADMLGGGHWQLPRGAWTDDTAISLCVAESLLSREEFVAADLLQRLGLWQREGHLSATGHCVGISSAVARALAPAVPADASPGDTLQALTRVGAVALFALSAPERVFDWAAAAIRCTDRTVEARLAGLAYTALLVAALRGARRQTLRAEALALLAEAGGGVSAPALQRILDEDAGGAGLAWLLQAVLRGEDFREGLLGIVNRGGDADVRGALYGQLAGALLGVEAIPKSWRNALLRRNLLENTADRLLIAALAPAA
jgi:ADP-ribosyl-[dinitrogen reductase] hydrolase